MSNESVPSSVDLWIEERMARVQADRLLIDDDYLKRALREAIAFGCDISKTKGQVRREKRAKFVPPTEEEVAAYCRERGNNISPKRFLLYYGARRWKNIVDWKACVQTWEQNEAERAKTSRFQGLQEFADS